MESPENKRFMKNVVYDKNENQSRIHAGAHDFGSHMCDLQISRKVYPRSSVQRQYQIMFTLGSTIRLN
jgi:hypothetical protein